MKPLVTATCSNQEIIDAIDAAGNHRYSWRRQDWPPMADEFGKAWVIPRDIGVSTRENTSLLKRLRQMVKEGLLEQKDSGPREIRSAIRGAEALRFIAGMPRFKVKR